MLGLGLSITKALSTLGAVITTNLKMWLGFETSSIVGDKQITPDKSGNNNVGELFTGKALDFDGENDYVDLGSQSNPATNMTFACWLNPVVSGSTSNQSIIDYGKFNVWLNDNDTLVIYTNTGESPVNYTISDLNNKWSRLVVSVSGTITSVYIDSTLIAAKTTPALSDSSSQSDIGREGTSKYYDGKLSDLQVYNVAWTQADVTFDYDNPQNLVTDRAASTIVLSNLKGYWHLSEGAGSTVYDSSGENNNGTIDGATYEPAQPRIPQLGMMNFSNGEVATGVTLIPDPDDPSKDIDGNAVRDRLNSLNLDGTGYAKVVDDDTINPTEAITVECWVYWTNTVTDKGLVAKWSNDDDFKDYMLYKESATKFQFYIGAQAKRCDTALSNGWNHIVGTYDRTNMKVYLNGVIDGTLAHTSAITNTTHVLEIGRYRETANRSYSERIDDARIYDRDLSATEVLKNYNAGLSAHTN